METGKANKIQAKTFNSDHAEQYHLSVQIGLTHLIYCIINTITNNLEYLNNLIINDDFINIVNKEDILKLNFASSSVAFTNFPCTLIPNALFKENSLEEILRLNTDVYEIIRSNQLAEIDTHLAYTIPSVINDIVFTFFPNAKQKAQQTILIEQFSKYNNKEDNVYLYINDNVLDITAFRNNKLLLNNAFNFTTKEDILYFTLFVFEQLKIDAETVNVILYGEIIKRDENHQLLYDYIRNIEFGKKPDYIHLSSEFNNLQDHQFYALFSQYI